MLRSRYGEDGLASRLQLPNEDLAILLSTVALEKQEVNLPPSEDVLRAGLIRKLDPARSAGMSGKLAAIVGYILETRFAEPAVAELVVTHDGYVLGAREGDSGANELIGSRADLDRSLAGLLNSTPDLTDEEIALFGILLRARIVRW
jgi:hypothetical protein